MASGNVLITDDPIGLSVTEVNLDDESIPDDIYWPSMLTALNNCKEFGQLVELVAELKRKGLRPPPEANTGIFVKNIDIVNAVAQKEIPPDGPTMLKAVFTQGDGNCLCQSVNKANYNHDGRHVELCVRMVMEGIENIDYYLSDECLECGASYTHGNADFPTVFATFSDFYTSGQRLTKETIRYNYIMEIHSCCRIGSYMGLWQLAQAASVIRKPIHTIYPEPLQNDALYNESALDESTINPHIHEYGASLTSGKSTTNPNPKSLQTPEQNHFVQSPVNVVANTATNLAIVSLSNENTININSGFVSSPIGSSTVTLSSALKGLNLVSNIPSDDNQNPLLPRQFQIIGHTGAADANGV